MERQQTQLRLVIDNLDIPVNAKPDTYSSVITAWTSAMNQMEKLLCGVPLQVHGGDILLGLLSWHLYPDMKYLSTTERDIRQGDHLLEGRGILTLGLEPSPRMNNDCRSVYWALPLAHLRFYGRLPVTKTRSVRTSDRDRITVDEMLWAVLSAYILPWDDGSVPTKDVLQFVSDVALELHWACGFEPNERTHKYASGTWRSRQGPATENSWLGMLSRLSLRLKDRLSEERIRKVRAMGQRFCPAFEMPFQNIFTVQTYLKAAYDEEHKIRLLRALVSQAVFKSEQNDYEFVITYRPHHTSLSGTRYQDVFEYATACPEYSLADFELSKEGRTKMHRRWLGLGRADGKDAPAELHKETQKNESEEEEHNKQKGKMKEEQKRQPAGRKDLLQAALESRAASITSMGEEAVFPGKPGPYFHRTNITDVYGHRQLPTREKAVEVVVNNSSGRSRRPYAGYASTTISLRRPGDNKDIIQYEVVQGDVNTIALLRRRRSVPPLVIQRKKNPEEKENPEDERLLATMLGDQLTVRQIMRVFQPGAVNFATCANQLNLSAHANVRLLTLTFIEQFYMSMSNTTIDVRSIQIDFNNSLWARSLLGSGTSRGKRSGEVAVKAAGYGQAVPCLTLTDADTAVCFACIAMMETGSYNLNPADLGSVFAICVADSLYIASALLQDPATSAGPGLIHRYTGNINRAGMAFMVPPKDPEIRNYDRVDEWYQYDHKEFTGTMEDCFQGTSLHISFSEASQAVNINFSGEKDVEAYFLETLISVYDRKTWIAEVDILGAMADPLLDSCFLTAARPCDCDGTSDAAAADSPTLISIDNFAEMIVPPRKPGIIRATGNWQARLAAVAICVAKGHKVILKPERTCWRCLMRVSLKGRTVRAILDRFNGTGIIL
ncbi:hypothetical protein F4778DRAFT_528245 [Xylariomycetidae sp. FL2044]|nr:hypothetical protein F4778DRAFT_528245 [Xylariomycetidae sp. FL2044]